MSDEINYLLDICLHLLNVDRVKFLPNKQKILNQMEKLNVKMMHISKSLKKLENIGKKIEKHFSKTNKNNKRLSVLLICFT